MAVLQLSIILYYDTLKILKSGLDRGPIILDTMPKRCKAFSKTIYPGYELRRMLVDNYSVFYYLDDNTVTVTDIIYSRSDILERLNK
jgi:hypothetical protein